MATKEEITAQAEAEMRDRVFAKVLRDLPKPAYDCVGQKQHKGANFTIVEWRTEGTGADDDWWCDACEIPIRHDTPELKVSTNGQPRCGKCESPLVEAAQRRPVVVKVRPCIRCGVVFWDRMEV